MRNHRRAPTSRVLLGITLAGGVALAVFCLLPRPTMIAQSPTPSSPKTLDRATLGGGCFWCLEAAYERFKGVSTVTSGYAGGHVPNPTYKQVCGGDTGHAEVVQIQYDPTIISYAQLLEIFWEIHDPTTPNRQGPDVGSQYRSIILYHNAEQRKVAEESIQGVSGKFDDPIVTELVELKAFFPAEEQHQDFYSQNPSYPYCAVVIGPKLKKLEKVDLPKKRGSD